MRCLDDPGSGGRGTENHVVGDGPAGPQRVRFPGLIALEVRGRRDGNGVVSARWEK